MARELNEKRRHFILEGVTQSEEFKSKGRGRTPPVRPLNRSEHGPALQRQISELHSEVESVRRAQEDAEFEDGLGLQVEFQSFPDIELAFESLAREAQGIELLNVRHDENRVYATIFVPDGKLVHFEGLIRDYLAEKKIV